MTRASVKESVDIADGGIGLKRYPIGQPTYPKSKDNRGTQHVGKAHEFEISVKAQDAKPRVAWLKLHCLNTIS